MKHCYAGMPEGSFSRKGSPKSSYAAFSKFFSYLFYSLKTPPSFFFNTRQGLVFFGGGGGGEVMFSGFYRPKGYVIHSWDF